MKRKVLLAFLLFFIFLGNINALELAKNSTSAIVIESSTGKILYEKNKDEKRSPASMTKIMTLLLIMEKLDKGDIKLDDKVYISSNASSMGGSQIYVEENGYYSVEELIKGIAIASANDASVAMAEYIGGSEENFVKLMNDKAKSLGLTKTVFKNSHGLDEEGHYTTAYELSLIARELINNYPSILKYTSTYEDYLTKNDNSKFWLVNTNKLIRFYKGVDGLKTGYTKNAGYCLTSTIEKNGMRIISVVMDSKSNENRSSDTVSLIEYSFSNFYSKNILKSNEVLGKISIKKGKKDKCEYKLKNDLNIILSKIDENKKVRYETKLFDIEAPISIGDKVGIINVYDEFNKIIANYDLISNENVERSNFINTFFKNLRYISSGMN